MTVERVGKIKDRGKELLTQEAGEMLGEVLVEIIEKVTSYRNIALIVECEDGILIKGTISEPAGISLISGFIKTAVLMGVSPEILTKAIVRGLKEGNPESLADDERR